MRMHMIVPAAAAALLAAAAPALARGQATASAVAVAPGPDGTIVTNVDDSHGKTDRLIILERHGAGPDGLAAGERRKVRVYSMNDANLADCADHPFVDRSSADGRERTKIVLCTRGEEVSSEDRSARLEHVLERIQHMDGLSDASKERVTAALRGAIEELRNSH
jgi:hypothetical protein